MRVAMFATLLLQFNRLFRLLIKQYRVMSINIDGSIYMYVVCYITVFSNLIDMSCCKLSNA